MSLFLFCDCPSIYAGGGCTALSNLCKIIHEEFEDIRSETNLFERSELLVSCEYQKFECNDLTN